MMVPSAIAIISPSLSGNVDIPSSASYNMSFARRMRMFKPSQPSTPQVANVRKLSDGSEISYAANGMIVATTDVLGERREFALDEKSAKLMVKRFGLWTTPEQARIDEFGALYFRRGDLEILERLDGVHIQANKQKGVTIKNDQKNKIEVIEQANGEVWKRETTDVVEHFWIWKDEVPRFKSDTYFKPARLTANTPGGHQALSYVSRFEQSWERGLLVREKYSFHNDMNDERHVAVALTLNNGMLMLRNVVTVTTTFMGETPMETLYTLSAITNLKIDLPTMKATFDSIKEVRSVLNNQGLCATFRKSDGTEQVLRLGT
jgi:hypothetical protein